MTRTHAWRATLILLALTLVSTELLYRPGFWSSHVRDVVGPALFYVFLRGLHRPEGSRWISEWFTANRTALLILGLCFAVEGIQYLGLYSGYFDLRDFVAYGGGVLPCYTLDRVTHDDEGHVGRSAV